MAQYTIGEDATGWNKQRRRMRKREKSRKRGDGKDNYLEVARAVLVLVLGIADELLGSGSAKYPFRLGSKLNWNWARTARIRGRETSLQK